MARTAVVSAPPSSAHRRRQRTAVVPVRKEAKAIRKHYPWPAGGARRNLF
ncbi:hypothetical protein ACIPY3_20155 [Paenarthrobacter sp. NPDC089714]